MATQLRLVDPPPSPPTRRPSARAAANRSAGARRARMTRSNGTGGVAPRRAVRWGEWHLDDRTRRIGRAGIAAAREALDAATATDGLSRAS